MIYNESFISKSVALMMNLKRQQFTPAKHSWQHKQKNDSKPKMINGDMMRISVTVTMSPHHLIII